MKIFAFARIPPLRVRPLYASLLHGMLDDRNVDNSLKPDGE